MMDGLMLDTAVLPPAAAEAFGADVLSGLARPQKSLPSKYFYDARGSDLFEQICELPEYYPTRTEIGLLHAHAADIATAAGRRAALIEFGSGASSKVRKLLDALDRPQAYVPVDISGDHLHNGAAAIAADYPGLSVLPVHADFTRPFALPETGAATKLGFFPGSTIGNFTPSAALRFLIDARQSLGPGSCFLIGVDLKKDPAILHAAYNDRAGVTAAFNLNLLRRINRELGGDFDVDAFAHRATYNSDRGAVEMHLVSRRTQRADVLGQSFDFAVGETIHTEDSHKYTTAEFQDLARGAGWHARYVWCDPNDLFSLHFLVAD